MSNNNLEQSNLELIELNEDELDVVAGGRGGHHGGHKGGHKAGKKAGQALEHAGNAASVGSLIYTVAQGQQGK